MTPSDSVTACVVSMQMFAEWPGAKKGTRRVRNKDNVARQSKGRRRETPARHSETSARQGEAGTKPSLLFRSRVRCAVTSAFRDRGKYPHRQE